MGAVGWGLGAAGLGCRGWGPPQASGDTAGTQTLPTPPAPAAPGEISRFLQLVFPSPPSLELSRG